MSYGYGYSKTKRMTIEDQLAAILRNPDIYQPKGLYGRPSYVTEALCVAMSYVPYGSVHQRALDYVVRNPQAIFNFSGKDAVGKAISLALSNMLHGNGGQ